MMLVTERLILREFEEKDWEAVYAQRSDSETERYNPGGIQSEQQCREQVQRAMEAARQHPRRQYRLAVTLTVTGEVVGGCRLHILHADLREGEIGYGIRRQEWRQGYATEVATTLLTFGFEQLGLHRICADCHPDNVASWRVLEKAGMRREGWLRENRAVQTGWWDTLLYAALDHEWKERK